MVAMTNKIQMAAINYAAWAVYAVIVSIASIMVVTVVNIVFYKTNIMKIMKKLAGMFTR